MADAPAKTTPSRKPGDFLKSIVGRSVIVKLNSGVEYRGVLTSIDGYMNIAAEACQEWKDGQMTETFGDAFIRGNNVLYIKPNKA